MKMIEVDQITNLHEYQLVDARSPSEYRLGHVPNAINVPLFSDEQRHVIGWTYKNAGRHEAVMQGLAFVGPRMTDLAQQGLALAKQGRLLLYCARGGMRSESLGWLWSNVGLPVTRLVSGYKAFRRWASNAIKQPRQYLVIAGRTGTGKTEILSELAKQGEQVIDLEALACHRGSVLGNLGQPPQPTQQQFENELAVQLKSMQHDRPVWIENESRRIGTLQIPEELWKQVLNAPLIRIEAPLEARITRLVKEYGSFSPDQFSRQLQFIAKRLGRERLQDCVELLRTGQIHEAARLLCDYYDRKYQSGLEKQPTNFKAGVAGEQFENVKEIAQHLLSLSRALIGATQDLTTVDSL